METTVQAKIKIDGEVILDKKFEGLSPKEVSQKLADYIKAERLMELGRVELSVKQPAAV